MRRSGKSVMLELIKGELTEQGVRPWGVFVNAVLAKVEVFVA